MHEYHPYPKWKYHAEKEARIVADEAAELALGDGWVDSPADVGGAEEESFEELEAFLHRKNEARKKKKVKP